MINPISNTSLGKVLLVNIPYLEYLEHILYIKTTEGEYPSHSVTMEVIKDSNNIYSYTPIAVYTLPTRTEYLKSIGVYPLLDSTELSLLVAKSKLSNIHLYKVIFDEVETILSK